MSDVVPSERELEALKVIWARGEATVREICDAINKRGAELAYTTVLSLLQVMEQKGLVGHRATGRVYAYFSRIDRAQTFRRLARGFLDRVFDGAMDEYVLHALDGRPHSAADLARVADLIAQAKQRSMGDSRQAQDNGETPQPPRKRREKSS